MTAARPRRPVRNCTSRQTNVAAVMPGASVVIVRTAIDLRKAASSRTSTRCFSIDHLSPLVVHRPSSPRRSKQCAPHHVAT